MACAFIEHGPHTPHRPWELPSQSMVRTCCSSHVCFPAACLLALSVLNRYAYSALQDSRTADVCVAETSCSPLSDQRCYLAIQQCAPAAADLHTCLHELHACCLRCQCAHRLRDARAYCCSLHRYESLRMQEHEAENGFRAYVQGAPPMDNYDDEEYYEY